MYLIIREDSNCNERTPPWGAESIKDYYHKIVENLAYVEKNEKVKVDFEFSAYEFLILLKDFPEVRNKFKSLLKKGKIGFVNGTYSQAHIHTLTSESAFRQFELGLKTYKELIGKQVKVYAAQEAGVFDQLPQILKAFEYMCAVLPSFCYSITFLDPHELIAFMESVDMKITELGFEDYLIDRIDYTNCNEFGSWMGPDGSIFPLYLTDCQAQCRDKDIKNDRKRDLFHAPSIRIQSPDLLNFNDKIVEEVTRNCDYVVLEDALKTKLDKTNLSSRVLIKSYHSYLEGVDGDKINQVNRELENKILADEFLNLFKCILFKKMEFNKKIKKINLDSFWEILLRCQHHDVFYPSAPELRQKSIDLMEEEIKKLEVIREEIIKDINNCIKCKEIIINGNLKEKVENNLLKINVFNPYPKKRKDIVIIDKFPFKEIECDFEILDIEGNTVEWQKCYNEDNNSDYSSGISFIAKMDGLGLSQYSLKKGKSKAKKSISFKQLKKEFFFKNDFYEVIVNKDCAIKSLKLKHNDFELIANNSLANQLIANRGLKDKKILTPRIDDTIIQEGPVFTKIISRGVFDKSDCKFCICFYNSLQRIDFNIEFDFSEQTLGDFFSDESKLNLVWPFSFSGELSYDSPFGVSKSQSRRPVFAINWIKYYGNKASVIFLNNGHIKYFGKDNTINQVLAWGSEETRDYIRMGGEDILSKPLEFKLNGKVNFNYSMIVEAKNNSSGEYFLESSKIQLNPIIKIVESNNDLKGLKFLEIENKNIITTSIGNTNDLYFLRFFECDGKKSDLKIFKDQALKISGVRTISGDDMQKINPYKIGSIEMIL
jgi:hypothetical protein